MLDYNHLSTYRNEVKLEYNFWKEKKTFHSIEVQQSLPNTNTLSVKIQGVNSIWVDENKILVMEIAKKTCFFYRKSDQNYFYSKTKNIN